MDTEEFLDLVLPAQGLRCIAVPFTSGAGFKHSFAPTNGAAAKLVGAVDAQGRNVYFGCASFQSDGSRKGDNVAAVRAFWLDLDCGPGKAYVDQRAALVSLMAGVKAAGLPQPLLVSSGNGVHVYWPLTADIEPTVWRLTAAMLKVVMAAVGVQADPARTADIASVLRPVGSHHRKAAPKLVKALGPAPLPVDHNDFRVLLANYITANSLELPKVSGPRPVIVGDNADLMMTREFEPSNADQIADRCAVMAEFRDTAGNIPQPQWYASLGVLAHATDGEGIAQDWSSGHPDYSSDETAGKFAQAAAFPPTTCAKLGEGSLGLCKGCKYKALITSPISLGRASFKEPVQAGSIPPVMGFLEGGPNLTLLPAATLPGLPNNYIFDTVHEQVKMFTHKADDPPWTSEVVCSGLFQPIARMDEGAAGYSNWFELLGSTRKFVISTSVLMGGGKDLLSELGKHEIVASGKARAHVEQYLQSWITHLKAQVGETAVHQHFGWCDEGFVVGDRLLTSAGTKNATLRNHAKVKAPAFEPKGSYDVWRNVIDRAYNHNGQEAFQYLILCSFAAPLFSLFQEFGGITVFAHSEGTGVGKTTAQRAGIAAWGNWNDLQMADNKVTANMLWANVGLYHNLPVLFDELTNQRPELASDLVYSISSGRQKERMSSDGSPRTNNSNWSTILMASGNNLISEKLSLHRANAEAELARLFEFTVRCPNVLSPAEAGRLFPELLTNYGHAGLMFMDYVVKNKADVIRRLMNTRDTFITTVGATQAERYWVALQACVLMALSICRKLDILRFDQISLVAWITDQMHNNRVQKTASVQSPLEQLGQMLADTWQGVLSTAGEGDLTASPPRPAQVLNPRPTRQLVGRMFMPETDHAGNQRNPNEKAVLLLNAQAVQDWCGKHGVSCREILSAGVREGWIDPTPRRRSLGRGTTEYASVSSPVRCWEIDPVKMAASGELGPVMARLGVVTGGYSSASSSSSGSSLKRP